VLFCDKLNPYYMIFLLPKLWAHVMAGQESGAYLSLILGKMVVITKRRFDAIMQAQQQQMAELKLTKRIRVGILPFLEHFEAFANQAEAAFEGSQRRNDLDRWYTSIVQHLFAAIRRISEDPNSKSPPAVVQLENFHRLFSILSQFKIACLDQQRRDAKQAYQDALDTYVVEHMGKPLDKLSMFFDMIDEKIEQGLEPAEVSYQMAFSKTELRRLTALYPGKEVKKGLEQLYEKVEKHLCAEENLLQVVWHLMQDEFIKQYKHYDELIAECYPNSGIQLEFSINDVLSYFSDIAQKH